MFLFSKKSSAKLTEIMFKKNSKMTCFFNFFPSLEQTVILIIENNI